MNQVTWSGFWMLQTKRKRDRCGRHRRRRGPSAMRSSTGDMAVIPMPPAITLPPRRARPRLKSGQALELGFEFFAVSQEPHQEPDEPFRILDMPLRPCADDGVECRGG